MSKADDQLNADIQACADGLKKSDETNYGPLATALNNLKKDLFSNVGAQASDTVRKRATDAMNTYQQILDDEEEKHEAAGDW